MCLLALAFRQFAEFPVLILANREEYYGRPTAPAQFVPPVGDFPAWMGGLDLLAGGTWLGVNEFGLVVAVTNSHKTRVPANPPSRGLLCRSLLIEKTAVSACQSALTELNSCRYAGCNLLIANREQAFVVESADDLKTTELTPGLHLITNGALDATDDPRIARVRTEFDNGNPVTAHDWLAEAARICRLSGSDATPPICLVGTDRGTVSSTILSIGRDLQESQYHYATGSPSMSPHENLSPVFRQLLTSGGTTHPYRIRLRGPWRSQPLARAEPGGDGNLTWTTSDLPESATIRLPASWQELFGSFRGRIRFQRKFHPPSNIGPGDKLAIVFDDIVGCGSVLVNGEPLGQIAPEDIQTRFDITGRLAANNELTIDLEFTDFSSNAPPAGLTTPIAIEIQAGRSGFLA
jgi:uncharacterized protein with NRDE domain